MKFSLFFLVILFTALQSNAQVSKSNLLNLITELETMYELDQEYRKRISQMKTFDADLVNKMNTTDSLNKIRTIEILEEFGWLGRSQLGDKASEALFYIIQHADLTTMEKYFPQLQQLAQNKEAAPVHAAMMEDRILMYKGQKQIYGTQAKSSVDKSGQPQIYIWAIEDAERVNQRRANVGFESTIEEYAEQIGAIYGTEKH